MDIGAVRKSAIGGGIALPHASLKMIKGSLVMVRAATVAIGILYACDFFAFGGRYTEMAMRVISAIERSFV
jgi:hypothetical protein